MIYPKKLNRKKTDKLINILLISSIIIAVSLVIINKLITPWINWSSFVVMGFIYIWITVIYSIRRNTNIASHVLLQMIAISAVIFYIDKRLGFGGWSIYIGIPITLITANATMLILSIVCYKKYTQYAIYQLIIVCVSMIQLFIAKMGIIELGILNKISILISLLNFIISFILSYKDFYKAIRSNFHI